ncbi:hypothetical protein EYF80_047258 [Liparis tanakae]|uniref:Uncharacterized protein n=1 Tax=Liparis tanakae TaxID=230148 RepID=A0A4Z2FP37_9TELE|nr:hypothetical protein EYF80_047258 [Liparis tanakae]
MSRMFHSPNPTEKKEAAVLILQLCLHGNSRLLRARAIRSRHRGEEVRGSERKAARDVTLETSLLRLVPGSWRRERAEVSGGQWRSVEVSGGQWRPVKESGGQWRSVETSGGQWRSDVFFVCVTIS